MRIGINCGSGQRRFTSTADVQWINIDAISRPGHEPDLVADGAELPMFGDGTVDFFVLHHVLEHFGCGEALGLIREAHRVLKPGGSLLVFVPDLRILADRWLRGFDTQLYMTNVYGAYMGDEADRHKWGYDRSALAALLSHSDWSDLKMFDYRIVEGADIARDWWICGMECVR